MTEEMMMTAMNIALQKCKL